MQTYCGITHTKILKTIMILMVVIAMFVSTVYAVEADQNEIAPSDNQYFELRAVEIKEIDGQNKQVIMELWGHNMEFKRI